MPEKQAKTDCVKKRHELASSSSKGKALAITKRPRKAIDQLPDWLVNMKREEEDRLRREKQACGGDNFAQGLSLPEDIDLGQLSQKDLHESFECEDGLKSKCPPLQDDGMYFYLTRYLKWMDRDNYGAPDLARSYWRSTFLLSHKDAGTRLKIDLYALADVIACHCPVWSEFDGVSKKGRVKIFTEKMQARLDQERLFPDVSKRVVTKALEDFRSLFYAFDSDSDCDDM